MKEVGNNKYDYKKHWYQNSGNKSKDAAYSNFFLRDSADISLDVGDSSFVSHSFAIPYTFGYTLFSTSYLLRLATQEEIPTARINEK